MIACDCEVCTSTDKKDKRLRSSILVESATTVIVVDTTPDFRYQMLRAGVKKLDGVLFTHPHKDHLAGLDDVESVRQICAGESGGGWVGVCGAMSEVRCVGDVSDRAGGDECAGV